MIISRWVPFDIAKPFLDKKPYVVLSDCATIQDGEGSSPHVSENVMVPEHDDGNHEDPNDAFLYEDEEAEPEYESSDDDSGPESSGTPTSVQMEGDVGNILIGLKGSCVKYKVSPFFK